MNPNPKQQHHKSILSDHITRLMGTMKINDEIHGFGSCAFYLRYLETHLMSCFLSCENIVSQKLSLVLQINPNQLQRLFCARSRIELGILKTES